MNAPAKTGGPAEHAGSGTALDRLGAALTDRLDLATYRAIMASPTWYVASQAVVVTRSYDQGLEGGLRLLQFTHQHQAGLSAEEVDRNMKHLYWFLLDMLDRSDQWEAYLDAWAQIREHTSYTLTYGSTARLRDTRMAPFILRRETDHLFVHFLWLTAHRNAVIERKVQAKRRGQRLGNLMHHPQDELSDDEVRRRLAWVARLASWGGYTGPTAAYATDAPSRADEDAPARTAAGRWFTLSIDTDALMRELLRRAHERRDGVILSAGMGGMRS